MPAVFGMATGMEMLIRGSSVRFERTSFSRAAILVGAILGVLIAVVSTGQLGRRVLLVLAGMAAIVLASIIAYNTMQYLFIPLVPVMAMIVAAEIAVWVHRARRARLA